MIKKLDPLCQSLDLNPADLNVSEEEAFPLKVPMEFVAQMQPGNPHDPLLRQILPTLEEQIASSGFVADPVGDLQANPLPSLIHKYHGRVLLMASPRCDIHCRYCFRRHFPYETQINQQHWQQALLSIANDQTIHEVILSGGDPFSLSENSLLALILKIEQIPHVRTLRIHSRTPIVAPSKAPQNALLNWAKQSRLNKVLVVHCNHANELSEQTAPLLARYKVAGFHLLNQSVLLKNINDCSEILIALSFKLFEQGVLPYYLHQLDRVQGASHFEVNLAQAQVLHQAMRRQLPGYLVPKLVQEVAGQPYKTPL